MGNAMAVRLELEQDVSGGEGLFLAATAQPWLHVPGAEAWRSRWVRLKYRAGLFENPTRPRIRFLRRGGESVTLAMNGAVTGAAQWLGRMPDDTERVSINPVNRAGAFAFALDSIEGVSRLSLLAQGLRRHPGLALLGIGARLVGSREEAHHCLKFAVGGTPLTRYGAWQAERARDAALDGFDRVAWAQQPRLRFFMRLDGSPEALGATLQSLKRQYYPHWTLHALAAAPESLATYRDAMAADERLFLVEDQTAPLDGDGAGGFAACLAAGVGLSPLACGAVAWMAMREPNLQILYGDEDSSDAQGQPASPRFKPDFSPHFQAGRGYIGRGAFFRIDELARLGCGDAAAFLAREEEWLARALGAVPAGAVGHVRHILYRRPEPPRAASIARPPAGPRPGAVIVIPTRDRAALLEACIASLLRHTDYPDLRFVIVDNGSVRADALALLDKFAKDARFEVLRAPGAFNYSSLCNLGARHTGAPLLVFLNNDVTVEKSDWLARLADWAVLPDIGAVGAKLLFPDGRIQHAGVVMGMGESAGHLYRLAKDGPGYLDQLVVPREAMAVTGAAMAVDHAKFDAVGGFDEAHFPVLYNDTDLCLRLGARGWHALLEPRACLTHIESASRGRPVDPFTRHRQERRDFLARWPAAIRDDPYFHPALSLYSYTPELG